MKRKVEYFVERTERLKKGVSFEERLNELIKENRTHFVFNNKGQLYRLKDAEVNNAEDEAVGIECVHFILLTPETGWKNTITVLFHIVRFLKNAFAIKREFKSSTSIQYNYYQVLHKNAITRQIETLELLQREIDVEIKEHQLKVAELENLIGRINPN